MSVEYVLKEIEKNCKNKRKKKVAIDFLRQKMEAMKYDDKLRLYLWEIINNLETIETSTPLDDD